MLIQFISPTFTIDQWDMTMTAKCFDLEQCFGTTRLQQTSKWKNWLGCWATSVSAKCFGKFAFKFSVLNQAIVEENTLLHSFCTVKWTIISLLCYGVYKTLKSRYTYRLFRWLGPVGVSIAPRNIEELETLSFYYFQIHWSENYPLHSFGKVILNR